MKKITLTIITTLTLSINLMSQDFQQSTTSTLTSDSIIDSTNNPVKLISFKLNNDELIWETATEYNNMKFEIEKSYNGVSFDKIGEVKGKGFTEHREKYYFNIAEESNKTYYRLKQIDFDYKFEYSKIISSKEKNEFSLQIYPNPSKTGRLNIEYKSKGNNIEYLNIVSIEGKTVFSNYYKSYIDFNIVLDLKGIDNGYYFLSLGTNSGVFNRKILIRK